MNDRFITPPPSPSSPLLSLLPPLGRPGAMASDFTGCRQKFQPVSSALPVN
ncbi:unnamed protein product [Hydatigera taeniaeformis]|uniref:Uncharacterized protein n=1 Tax=Hydatigena taeniaeformis TaxID=6205 RepID=A0A0R3X2B6_HYDTA|nr:unnamed protein product [Hydatigera taeniaeformis]